MKHLPTLGLLTALVITPLAQAQEKDDALAKQKSAAADHWKKMEFKKPGPPMLETPHLLVHSRLTEAKTKTLAANLDKAFTTASKALKYDSKDVPWPGKLAVFVLPERDEFVEFVRKVTKKAPEEDDTGYNNVAGDIAMVVAGAPRVGSADSEDEARAGLTTLLLRRKLGGADPPDWLASGFARATASRMVKPTSKAMSNPPPVTFGTLWNDEVDAKSKAIIATYLVDYLAYGPGAGLFGDFVGALRPDEGGRTPPLKDAATAIKLDEASLEVLARQWKKPPAPKPKKP